MRVHSQRIAVVAGVIAGIWACTAQTGDEGSGDSGSGDSGGDGTDSDGEDTDTLDTDGFEHTGLCGFSGQAVVPADAYRGTQDRYLIGDQGQGEDICRVRVELNSTGAPPVECDQCEWSFALEMSNAAVLADVDQGCANSSLELDEAAVAALNGQRVSYGYCPEYIGHSDVLMQYDETTGDWTVLTFAQWDSETGELAYDKKEGWCGY